MNSKKLILLFIGCFILFSNCSNNDEPIGTENEDELFITEIEREVIDLVNEERAKVGLPALEMHKSLMLSADIRAEEIKTKFSHVRPDGTSYLTVIDITCSGSGENIAGGYADAVRVMTGWMNSEGHRNNILNKNFTHIGVGYYKAEHAPYWVQLFAKIKQ